MLAAARRPVGCIAAGVRLSVLGVRPVPKFDFLALRDPQASIRKEPETNGAQRHRLHRETNSETMNNESVDDRGTSSSSSDDNEDRTEGGSGGGGLRHENAEMIPIRIRDSSGSTRIVLVPRTLAIAIMTQHSGSENSSAGDMEEEDHHNEEDAQPDNLPARSHAVQGLRVHGNTSGDQAASSMAVDTDDGDASDIRSIAEADPSAES